MRNQTTGEFLENRLLGAGYDFKEQYEHFAHTDPSMPISMRKAGTLVNDVEHYSDAFFESTPLYNEVMKKADARYRVTSILPLSDELVAGFAVIRSKARGRFQSEEVDGLELLLPHIVRVLRLQRKLRRLESEADDIVAALDRLPSAALIVSEGLEIICLNRQAQRLLKASSALRVRRGKLGAERAKEASALRKAVIDAVDLADGAIEAPVRPPQIVSVSRGAKLPLNVVAVPLRPRYQLRQNTGEKGRVMLLIYDPARRPRVDVRVVERLFDLTPTEAVVAARLAEGFSVTEVANDRGCSRSTIRTHLKHIFQKTHTHRQGELVQLILTSPAISCGG